MRIAQVSPLMESVPPRLYGGTERIVSYLTEELVELGHDVPCLLAPIQSRPPILWDVPPWRCGLNRSCAIQSRITC